MAGEECCETLRKCLQPLIDLIFSRRSDENVNYVPVQESEYAPNVEQDPLLSEALAKNYQAIVENAAKEFLQAAKTSKPRSNSSAPSVPSEQIALIRQRLVTAVVDPALAMSPPSSTAIIPIVTNAAAVAAPALIIEESSAPSEAEIEEQCDKAGETATSAGGCSSNGVVSSSSNNIHNSSSDKTNGSKKKKNNKKTKQLQASG